MPNQFTGLSADEIRAKTEDARRAARYRAAEQRIRRIVDGAPPLTDEQRARLAALLRPHLGREVA